MAVPGKTNIFGDKEKQKSTICLLFSLKENGKYWWFLVESSRINQIVFPH
jgi:hypothetical protein